MAVPAPNTEASFLRRFRLVWGAFSVSYAVAVLYRALVYHNAPGLPTLAGVAAVIAVWLDFFAYVRTRLYLRVGVICFILLTCITNIAVIAISLKHGRGLPIGRALLTVIFAFVLHDKLLDVLASRNHT